MQSPFQRQLALGGVPQGIVCFGGGELRERVGIRPGIGSVLLERRERPRRKRFIPVVAGEIGRQLRGVRDAPADKRVELAGRYLAEPLAACVNRLVIGPLVAWPLAAAIGLGGVTARTSIMMAGMPTAVMSTILAIELDARAELVVRTVVLSTLLSIASLTVLITILR